MPLLSLIICLYNVITSATYYFADITSSNKSTHDMYYITTTIDKKDSNQAHPHPNFNYYH